MGFVILVATHVSLAVETGLCGSESRASSGWKRRRPVLLGA